MGRLKILAEGSSQQARIQARGKLFEAMMAEVLRRYGYSTDRILNANYAGMEIGIEGKHKATGLPLYAECKYYETAATAPELQAFYGKYMTRWLKDKQCHGLFIVLPGVDSPAKEFYRKHLEENSEVTVRLYEEDHVLKAISSTPGVVSPDTVIRRIAPGMGKLGDCFLLYTEKGLFWVQYITSHGKENPDRIALFDAGGIPLSERSILGYLMNLCPELDDFDNIAVRGAFAFQPGLFQDAEEIVEVKGGSEYFEYQFPASPEHFIGRKTLLEELDSFVNQIINKKTSSRNILFEAPSGWGKSSMVLASVARLQEMGHFAVAVDSRSASSSRFILRVVDSALHKFGDFGGLVPETNHAKPITGFDGAVKAIFDIGQILERHGKVLVAFLDQFEHTFFRPDVLKPIRDLFLKVCDAQTNVVFGFSWKTDLIGLTNASSIELRDAVTDSSKHIILNPFSEVETHAHLRRLSDELNEIIEKDLQLFLSEFSQGYPWLLKKLCFHVRVQRQAGIPQSDIVKNLLSVEELFQEDLQGLSAEEKASLMGIAKAAPIRILESNEKFELQVVQSLVKQKLVIRTGNTYDVYWEILRDYLNTGVLPVLENYIFQSQVTSVIKAATILTEANGSLDTSEFQAQTGLSGKSFYRVARDMDLLGLAKVINGKVTLQIKIPTATQGVEVALRNHLQDRLRGNRLVRRLLKTLKKKNVLAINEVSELLEISCPYISIPRQTWLTCARILARWMDAADLALLDKKNRRLICFDPRTEIRERQLLLPKRRGAKTPRIQYTPVENVASRLVQALHGTGIVNWTGLGKSTIFSALAVLEDLGFIIRKAPLIKVLPKGLEFVSNPDKRPLLFAEGALQMTSFAIFIEILKAHQEKEKTLLKLGLELREKLGKSWQENTAETIAKIMMDWARHSKLAPGVFAEIRKGPIKGWKKKEDSQMTLFSDA